MRTNFVTTKTASELEIKGNSWDSVCMKELKWNCWTRFQWISQEYFCIDHKTENRRHSKQFCFNMLKEGSVSRTKCKLKKWIFKILSKKMTLYNHLCQALLWWECHLELCPFIHPPPHPLFPFPSHPPPLFASRDQCIQCFRFSFQCFLIYLSVLLRPPQLHHQYLGLWHESKLSSQTPVPHAQPHVLKFT